MTGLLLLIGGYLESTIQAEFKVDPLPAWAWTLLVIALIGVVLYFGVRVSVRSQLVLALISIIVVTIFFIVVIVKLGSANSAKPFNPSSAADGWSGIFFGVLYGVLMFVGFENAANLAEETPEPDKHIPAAVMITAGIATVFFLWPPTSRWPGSTTASRRDRRAGAPLFALGAPASAGGYRRHLDRPVARARGVLRHAGGRDRLRRVRVPRDLRNGPGPADPGRPGHRLAAARLAAGCDGVPDRRVPGHARPSTSGGRACSRCRTRRTLLAVRLGGPRSAASLWWWCTC